MSGQWVAVVLPLYELKTRMNHAGDAMGLSDKVNGIS